MSNTRRPSNPSAASRPATSRQTQAAVAGIVALCVAAIVVVAVLLRTGSDSGGAGDLSSSNPSPTSVDDVTCDAPPATPDSAQSFDQAPDPSLSQSTTWTATMHTSCGDITLELDGAEAPQTVASFISLAQQDYWAGSPCHRLSTSGIFVLQCGDPTGSGAGDPGYGFGVENAPASGKYPRGSLAMARGTDPNTNGGQFFLVYDDTQLPTEGGGYSIFGQVTGGMPVVDAIAAQGVEGGGGDGAPAQPISILSMSVEKR